jgi:hypothetical protein
VASGGEGEFHHICERMNLRGGSEGILDNEVQLLNRRYLLPAALNRRSAEALSSCVARVNKTSKSKAQKRR